MVNQTELYILIKEYFDKDKEAFTIDYLGKFFEKFYDIYLSLHLDKKDTNPCKIVLHDGLILNNNYIQGNFQCNYKGKNALKKQTLHFDHRQNISKGEIFEKDRLELLLCIIHEFQHKIDADKLLKQLNENSFNSELDKLNIYFYIGNYNKEIDYFCRFDELNANFHAHEILFDLLQQNILPKNATTFFVITEHILKNLIHALPQDKEDYSKAFYDNDYKKINLKPLINEYKTFIQISQNKLNKKRFLYKKDLLTNLKFDYQKLEDELQSSFDNLINDIYKFIELATTNFTPSSITNETEWQNKVINGKNPLDIIYYIMKEYYIAMNNDTPLLMEKPIKEELVKSKFKNFENFENYEIESKIAEEKQID